MGSHDDPMPAPSLATHLEELTGACARLAADLAVLRTMVRARDSGALAPTPTAAVGGGARLSVAEVGIGGMAVEAGLPPPVIVAGGEGTAALTVEGREGAVGLRVHTDRGPGIRVESGGRGLQIESRTGPAVRAETMDAAAIVASSVGSHGVHAVGGGVSGGLSSSERPCGVFAEGGSGDGVYATSAGIALRAVSTAGYGASLSGGRAPLHLIPASTVGPPTSGAYLPGAIVVDAAITMWLCMEAGTPGTWHRVVTQPGDRSPVDGAATLRTLERGRGSMVGILEVRAPGLYRLGTLP